nr:hypothetical protein [Tanacetum cinerariifolium]
MIPEQGDPNREVPVNETFHVQTDNKLTNKELKQIKADDQAIQTILLSLPEDIYAAVDSCETAQEIYCSMNGKGLLPLMGNRLSLTTIVAYKLMNDLKQNKHFPEKIASSKQLATRMESTYPTTAMNMALALMAKAFKLNYLTPTNNNQRISSNPCNRQIAQPGMNMGKDRQMQMVGGNAVNQFRQYARKNVRNLNGYNDV